MTCPSCGGQIGRDCFNPQECAEITADMELRSGIIEVLGCISCSAKDAEIADLKDKLAEADKAETQLIQERDDAVDAFDELVGMLEVETEYSNVRGYAEIIEDCQVAIDNGVGKTWHADNHVPLQAKLGESERARAGMEAWIAMMEEQLRKLGYAGSIPEPSTALDELLAKARAEGAESQYKKMTICGCGQGLPRCSRCLTAAAIREEKARAV